MATPMKTATNLFFFVHLFAVVLHDQNVKLLSYTLFFIEELSYVFTKNFVACVLVRLYFLHLRSFSPCLSLLAGRQHFSFSHCRFEIFSFFLPTKFVSFLFNHSLSLFLCYSLECRHKKQRRKRLDYVFVFLSKSPIGHAISRQKYLELPVVLYLLIDLYRKYQNIP